ncbi:MAG: tRNA (adenosine(37)-N6)-threonylcarbamoyltransferase complex dimerization subunit type 1 TsaB [Desulfovibrio sp.]|jgi:tRNA threonylcarbamoyl adenosine modification protein YeaZ|nr:tRNA (adenosine(37)-N6)-threonylcarbamoyltransferase complex dimerization subunit type 1 TsaB [Desulfovibrio sp.]
MSAPYPLLIINTAEGLLQVAVVAASAGVPRLEAWAERRAESRGAELLAPLILEAAAHAGIAPASLRGTAAVRGPGGFTGLRLAAATAAGLARGAGTLTAGLEYLPLLAASAMLRGVPADEHHAGEMCAAGGVSAVPPTGISTVPPTGVSAVPTGKISVVPANGISTVPTGGPEHARRLWVLVHARKTLLYAQAFDAGGDTAPDCDMRLPAPDGDILLLTPEEAAARIAAEARQDGPRPELLGSGVRNHPAIFAALTEAPGKTGRAAPALLLPAAYDNPAPEALLRAAAYAEWSREDIVPRYFRPPDAEENLAAVARALGLDPEAAKARLEHLRASLPQD